MGIGGCLGWRPGGWRCIRDRGSFLIIGSGLDEEGARRKEERGVCVVCGG